MKTETGRRVGSWGPESVAWVFWFGSGNQKDRLLRSLPEMPI